MKHTVKYCVYLNILLVVPIYVRTLQYIDLFDGNQNVLKICCQFLTCAVINPGQSCIARWCGIHCAHGRTTPVGPGPHPPRHSRAFILLPAAESWPALNTTTLVTKFALLQMALAADPFTQIVIIAKLIKSSVHMD